MLKELWLVVVGCSYEKPLKPSLPMLANDDLCPVGCVEVIQRQAVSAIYCEDERRALMRSQPVQ